MKKKLIIPIFLLFLTLSMIVYFKLKPRAISEDEMIVDQLSFLKLVDKFSIDLKKRYYEGDFDQTANLLTSCPEYNNLTDVGPNYLVCNQHFVSCWVRDNISKYQLSVKEVKDFRGNLSAVSPHSKSFTGATLDSSVYGIKIHIHDQSNDVTLFIENKCDEIKLEERIYITKSEKEFIWDNFDLNISIDKYPVSVNEVNWWIAFDYEAPKEKYIESKNEWHKPSTNLTVKEKKDFCVFKGRRILESHIYDAATILPSIIHNPLNRYLKIYPYPWTKNLKDVFAYKARNTSNFDQFLTYENCQRIFSSECAQKFKFKYYSTNSISWNGFNMILGGFSEFLVNRLEPEKEVKKSSSKMPMSSKKHQLALRDLMDENEELSFRCMREQ